MWIRGRPVGTARLFWGGLAAFLALALPLGAEQPLSAIDWLSKSVKEKPLTPDVAPKPAELTPAPATPAPVLIRPDQPAISAVPAPGAPDITVTPLADVEKDAVGLLPSAISGLPANFWGDSDTATLAGLIRRQPTDSLPEVQSLLYTILLAEVNAPKSDKSGAQLLLARTDKLLDFGALEQAQALLERAGPSEAEIFRRWFDVSLLTGHVDHACVAMQAAPGFAPTLEARIFCLARNGDWNAAAVTLATGETLGFITKAKADLLSRFLDPGMYEGTPDLPVPAPLTPLDFTMREAIAQPRPTGALPPAFLGADLSPNSPWRNKIEAAERLVRLGALTPNQLIELYTAKVPAASGGIWDRAAAIQAFDVALLSGDVASISTTLPTAYSAMRDVALEVPFANHYGDRLEKFSLTGKAADIAFRVEMLSKGYETAARHASPTTDKQKFVIAVALGAQAGNLAKIPPSGTLEAAIAAAFLQPVPAGPLFDLLAKGDLGEAILRAMLLLKDGAFADPGDIQAALATFRAVGLEDAARRTAIELLLLERRG